MGICDCGKETIWNDMCEDCNHKYDNEIYESAPMVNKCDSNFYVEKIVYVAHIDGWRYAITMCGEPQEISITYQELKDGDWVDKETICGLWKESALMIANALKELSVLMED